MNATEEYNKILQLVKSDCPNNRLLGFQLAKGLGYDLIELLELIIIKTISFNKCHIGKYYYHYHKMGWNKAILTIDIINKDKVVENIKSISLTESRQSSNWIKILNEFKQDFINLIINE